MIVTIEKRTVVVVDKDGNRTTLRKKSDQGQAIIALCRAYEQEIANSPFEIALNTVLLAAFGFVEFIEQAKTTQHQQTQLIAMRKLRDVLIDACVSFEVDDDDRD